MAKFKFSNFASSTLSAAITATDTTLNLATGTGAKFPTLAAGEYFMLKVINSAKQAEIVKVTVHAASSDQLTVERAKEGTAARAFASGDAVQLILSKGLLDELLSRNPPAAKSANYTTVADDNGGYHELGAGVTQVTLGDASVLRQTTADVWTCRFKNVTTSNITIARAVTTDTINRVAGNGIIAPGQEITISVNAARNGFETSSPNGAAFTASGTDTYTVTGLSFVAGHDYHVTFTNANASTAPTLNGTTIKKEGGAALVAGDIPANHAGILRHNGTDLILLNPANNTYVVTTSAAWVCPATVNYIHAIVVGGGGGGGAGGPGTTGNGGGGGGGGGVAVGYLKVSPSTSYTITIGAGGAGGTGSSADGAAGSATTAFGLTANGGAAGLGNAGGGGGGGAAAGGTWNITGDSGANGNSITGGNGGMSGLRGATLAINAPGMGGRGGDENDNPGNAGIAGAVIIRTL